MAGVRGSNDVLEATYNGGLTWHWVLTLTAGAPTDLGFTTSSQGVVISAHRLYMTRDGGHSWHPVAF